MKNVINIICYADDIALIAGREDGIHRLLCNFHLSCLKFNMKMSIHKTKAVTVSKEPISCKLEMYGKMVEKSYGIYRNVKITSSENLVKEIKIQAKKAARVVGCSNNLVSGNKYMRKN
jgi:hypothetical protein